MSYDEDLALSHIKKHDGGFGVKDMSFFESSFPLEDIYFKLRKMLPVEHECKLYVGIFKNISIFKYDYNGRNEGKLVDYIQVITLHNSNDILTMYPIFNKDNLHYIDINPDTEEIILPNQERMSQVDKFKQKYKNFEK